LPGDRSKQSDGKDTRTIDPRNTVPFLFENV
jgi:hypothetical protein